MRNFCVLFAVLAFFAVPAWAQQEVIPLSSSLYDAVDALYGAVGLAPPSSVRPWTQARFAAILDRLEERGVPDRALRLFASVREAATKPLRLQTGGAGFDASLDLNFEAYAHSNKEDFVNEEDWFYGFNKRAPLSHATFEASLAKWFYVTSDIQYAWNFNSEDDVFIKLQDYPNGLAAVVPSGGGTNSGSSYAQFRVRAVPYTDNFVTNIPPDTYDIECVFPKRAFLSFGGNIGGTDLSLSLGRDKLRWGKGRTGSLVLGDSREFDNFVRFSAGADIFRYDLLTTIYDKFDYDGSGVKKSRYYMLHRLEFRPLPSLTLAVSENIMYQDEYFNIRYLNPAFIYHNWDEDELFNALAYAEAAWAIAPGWTVYGQYAMDQARAPNEGDSETDAWGLLLGAEYASVWRVAGGDVLAQVSLEGAYTSPLLYRRNNVDFLTLNRRVTFTNGSVYTIENIAFPYGGDAITAQADLTLNSPGKWQADARIFGMIHGQMNPFVSHNSDNDNTDNANLSGVTPSGDESTHEKTLLTNVYAKYYIPLPVRYLSLSAWTDLTFVMKWNKLMYTTDASAPIYYKAGLSPDFQASFGIGVVF